MGKVLSVAKKTFSIHFTSKYVLFQLRTKFFVPDKISFVWEKNILSGQMDRPEVENLQSGRQKRFQEVFSAMLGI